MFDITSPNVDHVIISGRFDAAQVEKADQIFDKINSDCIVDFQDLAYISSAGLGSLLKIHTRLKGSGYSVKLKNLNKHVREVFKYSGLDKVFIILE
jgi:anti-sigma B factor antagonist